MTHECRANRVRWLICTCDAPPCGPLARVDELTKSRKLPPHSLYVFRLVYGSCAYRLGGDRLQCYIATGRHLDHLGRHQVPLQGTHRGSMARRWSNNWRVRVRVSVSVHRHEEACLQALCAQHRQKKGGGGCVLRDVIVHVRESALPHLAKRPLSELADQVEPVAPQLARPAQ